MSGNRETEVVVVASVNADYVVKVDRRPAPGETVGGASFELHGGGKGANQALAASRCGAAVEMVACVGDDELGSQRIAELARCGVRMTHVRRVGVHTGVAFITLTPDGENSIVVAPGANALLTPGDLDAARHTIARAGILVVQLEIPLAAVRRALQLAPKSCIVVLNCAPYRELPAQILERVDVLVANESECAGLAGFDVVTVSDARKAATALLGRGVRSAVVTLGEDGAVVVAKDIDEHIPAPATQVVDTTGAGDAFVGALVAELSRGRTLLRSVEVATVIGSATTEFRGASVHIPPGLLVL